MRMMTATPRLAVIAISWIIRISISMMVMKPMVSDSRAMPPGTSRRRKVERAAVEAVEPVEDLGAEGADHLDAVADSDGEDQERHQYRHRVDAETEQGEKPQLPDHGHQRAADHDDRQLEALRVDVDEDRRDDEGDEEEEHHPFAPDAMSPMTLAKPMMW